MKIIHLADLHIGKIVNGFSMLEDQKHVLAQILQYVKIYSPDAVIIAGDVYDRPTPGTDAIKVFDQFLTDLAKLQTAVFIISGNHDSAERLSFGSRILQQQNIYLAGNIEAGMSCITLTDKYGEVNFYLLPFIKPVSIRQLFPDQTIESYDDAVKTVIEAAKIDYEQRNVLITHQFYTSSSNDPERSESEINPVGGIDNISTRHINDFDYVAIGHLHCAQQVGHKHIRYAGSPLKYSFSECHHIKSVSLFELEQKGVHTLTLLPLHPLHDLRKIKGPITELLSDAVIAQSDPDDYLHITLTDDDEIVDAIGKIRVVYPNVMTLTFENKRTQAGIDLHSIEPLKRTDSLALFESFFSEQNGRSMNPQQRTIITNFFNRTGGQ